MKNSINILCLCRVLSEHLQKLQLEDLREFLQERLAVSFFLPDDVVIEQLQAAMAELRSKKLAQPPPGADAFSFSALLISSLHGETSRDILHVFLQPSQTKSQRKLWVKRDRFSFYLCSKTRLLQSKQICSPTAQPVLRPRTQPAPLWHLLL